MKCDVIIPPQEINGCLFVKPGAKMRGRGFEGIFDEDGNILVKLPDSPNLDL
jgi:hypothetical protein